MDTLNKINARILRELTANGRISNAELATRVGLSPSACLRRVQELERTQVITGYRAQLNHEKMGIGCIAYVTVGLNDHTKAAQLAFEQAITLSPLVRECHNITGSYEYLITFKSFHTDVLGVLPQVSSITTFVVMSSPKDERC